MPTSRGRAEVDRYFAQLPDHIVQKLLRPAARAGGKVIAEEVKQRSRSQEVADAVVIKTRVEPASISAFVTVKPGWALSVATWQEYGTSSHFISVDDSQRQGRSVNRINRLAKDSGGNHSLVINGKFVGTTVLHPGAQAHPAFRPALDARINDAIKAAQQEIDARVRRGGPADDSEGGAE